MINSRLQLKDIKVLTTDPEKRIGLYAVRYLGKAGADVNSIGEYNYSSIPVAFLSKYIKRKFAIKKENYFHGLKDFFIKHSHEYNFINPIDISKMLCFLDVVKENNLKCCYLLPHRDSLVIADNKELIMRHATEHGLDCPKTYSRVPFEEIEKFSKEIKYPCIIKYRGDSRESSWDPSERYSIIHNPTILVSEYKRMYQIEEFPIIQEFIRGGGYGYFALFDKNRKLKAQFCHQRIREYPITGGPSSCCRSFYDPNLIRIGRDLLESLEWTGLAMVEFKYDEVRGKYYIIEVNPRYWGSIPLAIFSGVNFPVLHALSALEIDYTPVMNYRLGVKMRFIHKDIKSVFENIKISTNIKVKTDLFLELFDFRIKDGLIDFDDMYPLFGNMKIFNKYKNKMGIEIYDF